MLAAGLKGIEEGYELPPEATDNIYELTDEERAGRGHRRRCPRSLRRGARRRWSVPSSSPRRSASTSSSGSCATSAREWKDYKAQVTPFELDRYLGTL